MYTFISTPLTIVPFSSKNQQEGIDWALARVDAVQSEQEDNVLVAGIYHNMKTNEMGQVLSTDYATLVKNAFGQPELVRVFVKSIPTMENLSGFVDSSDLENLNQDLRSLIPEEQDLSGFRTGEQVSQMINDSKDSNTQQVDLSGYATKEYVDQNFETKLEVDSEYGSLNHKINTTNQRIDDLNIPLEVQSEISRMDIPTQVKDEVSNNIKDLDLSEEIDLSQITQNQYDDQQWVDNVMEVMNEEHPLQEGNI